MLNFRYENGARESKQVSGSISILYLSTALRLHGRIYVLYVVVLLDALDQLLDVSLSISFENLEIYVRKSCELCRNEFVTVLLDPFLDAVERRELTVKYDLAGA